MTAKELYNLNPNKCLFCGKDILCPSDKTVYQIKQKKFCNHSCAASYNNSLREKKKFYCTKCGELIGEGHEKFYRRKYCDKCIQEAKVDWSKVTLKEVKDKRQYQSYSRIRDLARKSYENSNKPKYCIRCNYNKHYEVHHIIPISSFEESTPISEINDLNNLIALCPNCHWELENGLFQLENYLTL